MRKDGANRGFARPWVAGCAGRFRLRGSAQSAGIFIDFCSAQAKHRSGGAAGEGGPMHTSLIYEPQHWRERAEEARTLAEEMTDPEARQKMLVIAGEYEELARRAANRAAPTK